MKIRFWGVRGSIPSPGAQYVKYGGNTLCVADGREVSRDHALFEGESSDGETERLPCVFLRGLPSTIADSSRRAALPNG